jgi:23S rRNA (pseudouridine1915-N3)-methyltransferase
MRLRFLTFQTSRESWFEEARDLYVKKIGGFLPVDYQVVRSRSADRGGASEKLATESSEILRQVDDADYLILFDERGRSFRDSVEWARHFGRALESGKRRTTLVIGGAYGVDDRVRKRADLTVSLSPLTLNHRLAMVVALEQIYRALTIRKGIPYHNA